MHCIERVQQGCHFSAYISAYYVLKFSMKKCLISLITGRGIKDGTNNQEWYF